MSHGGGVRKVPKKCHVLFEWPLNTSCQNSTYLFSNVCKFNPHSRLLNNSVNLKIEYRCWGSHVAGWHEAEGLPGCAWSLTCQNKLVWCLDKVVYHFILHT